MKTKSMILVGILIIALAVMAVPVMAADSAQTAVFGQVTETVDLSNIDATQTINLGSGVSGSPTAEVTVDAATNCIGTISAIDNYATFAERTEVSGVRGYMSNYTATAYVMDPLTKLTNPISVVGTTKGEFNAAPAITNLATSDDLFTFEDPDTVTDLTFTFTQVLSEDRALPTTDHYYRIPVLLSIACT